jgi:hypothetical protein
MALNSTFVTDEAGGYADWVEIVNAADVPFNVAGLHLTNRRSEPQRFTFPSFTVDPGDHRVLWCDNDPEDGPLHTSFNVESSGDDLILSVWDEFGWRCVDQISWDTQQLPNTSYGRVTDGADTWTTFVPGTNTPPTPNATNSGPSGDDCPADLTGDGAVGVGDVLMVLGEFGCATNCTADLDANGTVGVNDVLAVLSAFGAIC